MAKIYSVPDGIKVPVIDFKKIENYENDWNVFEAELKTFLKKRKPNDENVGEIIKFPVADGHALYMVASTNSPTELIHLPYMDEYEFQLVHLLNATEVKKQIAQQKAMEKLFGKKL